MKKVRRKFSAAFKVKVAIEALKERETLSELAKRFEIHSTQISTWKKEFLSNAEKAFTSKKDTEEVDPVEIEKLYTKIGQIEMEKDFLKKSLKKLGH